MRPSDGRLSVGPYRLGKRLGVGGMGEVYVAVGGVVEGPPVALKLLLPHLADDKGAVLGFLDEARLVARMNHPNLVRVFDVGMDDERLYLAMELVPGVPLSSLIYALAAAQLQPSPAVVLHVTRCLLEGLDHAHAQRGDGGRRLEIVHRDVSPQNLLVSVRGEVKLTDFGIAQASLSRRSANPTSVRGKFEYLAPEQARKQPVDRRADLFSVAATIAHLATLVSPFRRDTPRATLDAVEHDPFPDLGRLRPELPSALTDALAVAAQKSPASRFASARELLAALPPAPEGAPQELAVLVQQLCRDAVDEVAEKTQATSRLGAATLDDEAAPLKPPVRVTQPLSDDPLPERDVTVLVEPEHLRDTRPLADPQAALRRTSPDTPAPAVSGLGAVPRRRLPALGPWHLSALAAGLAVACVSLGLVVDASPATTSSSEPAQETVAATVEPAAELDAESDLELEVESEEPSVELPAVSGERRPPPARRKRARPPPQPKTAVGYLTVEAVPWAEVFVRGRRLGETPLATVPIETGQVAVLLKSPDTGRAVSRTVTITAGREAFLKENLR